MEFDFEFDSSKRFATPDQWRKKIQHLAELRPDAFDYLKIANKECKKAVSGQAIQVFKSIDTTKLYFLTDNRFIYGVFQVVVKTQKYNSFSTTNGGSKTTFSSKKTASNPMIAEDRNILTIKMFVFRNLAHYRNPIPFEENMLEENIKVNLLLEQLEKKNVTQHAVFLKLSLANNDFFATVASKGLPVFVENYLNKDKAALKELHRISRQINALLNSDKTQQQSQLLKKITILGGKLGKLIPLDKMLGSALEASTEIYVNNESNVPLQTINYVKHTDAKRTPFFPLLEKPTIFSSNARKVSHTSEHCIVRSLCVLNLLDDKNAEEESLQIQECLLRSDKHKSMPALFQNVAQNIESLFANYDCLHAIAHGNTQDDKEKNFYLRDSQQKTVLSLQQLKKFSRMPHLLFLSVCGSNHKEVVEHFFKNNGRILIVFDGLLFNQGIEKHISLFYNSLFKGSSVKSAVFSMQTKMLRDLNPNCYRMKLYGASDEVFFEGLTIVN